MFRGWAEAILPFRRCVISVAWAAPLVACAVPDVSAPLPTRIGSTSTELLADFRVLPPWRRTPPSLLSRSGLSKPSRTPMSSGTDANTS